MGDPKKIRKKYSGPSHPWEKTRIDEERILKKDYGLKSKKEIWKFNSKISKINTQAKNLVRLRTPQSVVEEKQLLNRLYNLGIIEKDTKLEDVLGLDIKRLLDRRLQSMVYKSKLSHSMKQARQFILHGHITIKGKKITIPSYIVKRDEENEIKYIDNSTLNNPNHPEIKLIKKEKIEIKEEPKREELNKSEENGRENKKELSKN